MRGWFRQATFAAIASVALISASLAEKPKALVSAKPHRLAIQVDQNDPAVMNLALNNATNVIEYYRAKGVDVAVDIVTYGPGLHMLRADTSPVQDRIKSLRDATLSQQDPVFRVQQHQGRYGEKRGPPDQAAL